jgi:hypothetical protein
VTENQELEDVLAIEQAKTKELDSQVVRLEAELRSTTQKAERAENEEKELSEKVKEQASQLLYVQQSGLIVNLGTSAANHDCLCV